MDLTTGASRAVIEASVVPLDRETKLPKIDTVFACLVKWPGKLDTGKLDKGTLNLCLEHSGHYSGRGWIGPGITHCRIGRGYKQTATYGLL